METGQLSEKRNITTKMFLTHCFPLACKVMCTCVFVFSERADTQTEGDDDALRATPLDRGDGRVTDRVEDCGVGRVKQI